MRIVKALLLLCGVLTVPVFARAESNLDRISRAKNKLVVWNAAWASDRGDDKVMYKIVDVSEIDKIPTRKITLELQAIGSATLGHRRFVIETEEWARAMNERVVEQVQSVGFPSPQGAELDSLPFIHYTKDGWVRADPEANETLAVCRIGQLRFSCPESQRMRFGPSLRSLEDDLKAQVPVEGS